jgi:dolichyl-phosphate beta-glucosyltransferase
MDKLIDFTVILPAYNEEATVERAIRETAAVFNPISKEYELIVVDDGSSDATAEKVAGLIGEFPFLKLLRHQINSGKGAAVRTGVMNAAGKKVFFIDCDLSTHPNEAPAFIARANDYDIIIGSRRVSGANIVEPQPWYRSLSGRIINLFVRIFLKLKHHDTQCGFKMFRLEAAQTIFKNMTPMRWTFDIEVLVRAYREGYKVGELPVAWRHGKVSRVRISHVLAEFPHLWNLRKKLF